MQETGAWKDEDKIFSIDTTTLDTKWLIIHLWKLMKSAFRQIFFFMFSFDSLYCVSVIKLMKSRFSMLNDWQYHSINETTGKYLMKQASCRQKCRQKNMINLG